MDGVAPGEEFFLKGAGFPVETADSPEPGCEGMALDGLPLEIGGMNPVSGAKNVRTGDALETEEKDFGMALSGGLGHCGESGRGRGVQREVVIAGPLFFWPGAVGEKSGFDPPVPEAPDQAGEVALGPARWGITSSRKVDFHGAGREGETYRMSRF